MPTLQRAGADIVMSYASMAASTVMNWLKRSTVLMVTEGLDLFKVKVPAELAGKTIRESEIRENTDCSLVAIITARGMEIVPHPEETIPADADILLIGSIEAEERFLEHYGISALRPRWQPVPFPDARPAAPHRHSRWRCRSQPP